MIKLWASDETFSQWKDLQGNFKPNFRQNANLKTLGDFSYHIEEGKYLFEDTYLFKEILRRTTKKSAKIQLQELIKYWLR